MFSEFVVGMGRSQPSVSMALGNTRQTMQLQGALSQTNGRFDFAVEGDGFFQLETAQGPRLTRAGIFTPNAAGELVNPDGHRLLDARRRADLRSAGCGDVTMARDGTLSADGAPIAQVGIVQPADPVTMTRAAGTLFAVDGDVIPVDSPQILQGFLEESNVDPMIEMSRMIDVQRAYERGQRLMQREDEAHQGRHPDAWPLTRTGGPNESLANCRNRHVGAANACRHDFQQPREHEHDRLSTRAAPNSPICITSNSRAPERSRPPTAQCCPQVCRSGLACVLPRSACKCSKAHHPRPAATWMSRSKGKGYLEVTLPNGEAAYTRDGGLKRTGDGLIVNSEGYEVAPALSFPMTRATCRSIPKARFTPISSGTMQPQRLGQLNLANFTNEKGWRRSAPTCFWKPRPLARHRQGVPGQDGLGTCARAIWKRALSTRCAK